MHVCFIFHHYYPSNFSTALLGYSKELVKLGHKVSVIAGKEKPETPSNETIDGVTIYRIPTDLSTSVSLEPTIFGWKAMKKVEQIHSQSPIDILHLRSFPNLGLVVDKLPQTNISCPVISDVRGTAVSNSVFEWISRVGIRIQDLLVDETLVIDENVASRIFDDTRDVTILPLGVDFDKFTPGRNEELREAWGMEDRLIVGYTGHLHTSRELGRFISAFEQAHQEEQDLSLVIVGDGKARDELEQQVIEAGIENDVIFTGSVPFAKVPSYLQAFDIGGAYVADKPQYRNQPPLKTVEYLATNLPVIATDTPGNRRFATEENAVLVDDRIDDYRDGLLRLARNEALRKSLSEKARGSVKEYSYETITEEKLLKTYQKNLNK